MTSNKTNRIEYLDYLKVLAAFGVTSGHIVCGSVPYVDILGTDWHVFNIYQSLIRWVLPVFFMCSGAIFLSRDISIKKIYTKYIPRMAVAFLFWGIIYSIHDCAGGTIWDYLTVIFAGHFHMWYIPAMIGVYMVLPLLRRIAQDKDLLKYFIILFLAMAVFLPTMLGLESDFLPAEISVKCDTICYMLTKSIPAIVTGYVGYFMMGYYFAITEYDKKTRWIIYALGILGAVLTMVLSIAIAGKTGESLQTYYDAYKINIAMMSLGVFEWGKYNFSFGEKVGGVVKGIAKYNFGIYLAHPLVIDIFSNNVGINTFSFGNVLVGIVVFGLMVFVVSMIIAVVISKIPVIGKYLV